MRKTSKIILVTIVATCILLGLGYAAIQNITLNIAGTASATANQGNFKVRFTDNITVSESAYVTATKSGDQAATIAVSGLTSAGQKVTATYEIVNESSDLSADLKVDTSNSNIDYFKISSKLGSSSLTKGDTTTVLVTVELTKTPIEEDVNATIGVSLTAMPVQPGEEGTSVGTNDFSQTPIDEELNEYGFYFKKAYSLYESTGEKISLVFYEDSSVAMFLDEILYEVLYDGEIIYSSNLIKIGEEEIIVLDAGKKLKSDGDYFELDYEFSNKFNKYEGKQNEYGYYFGEAYSVWGIDSDINSEYVSSIVLYENGAVDIYMKDKLLTEFPANTVKYYEDSIDISGISGKENEMMYSLIDGLAFISNGNFVCIDPSFWDRVSASKEINEYGFYYDIPYVYTNSNGVEFVGMMHENKSVEMYSGGVLHVYAPEGYAEYSENRIEVGDEYATVYDDGNRLKFGKFEYVIDENYMSRYKSLAKNEYGFYFEQAYSVYIQDEDQILTYIFYEDESAEIYADGSYVTTIPRGYVKYSENTITIVSENFEDGNTITEYTIGSVCENGRIILFDDYTAMGVDLLFEEK